jgi:hypothetical protein
MSFGPPLKSNHTEKEWNDDPIELMQRMLRHAAKKIDDRLKSHYFVDSRIQWTEY